MLCLLLSGYLPTDILAVVVLWPPVFADVAFCSVLCCICLFLCTVVLWLVARLFGLCGLSFVDMLSLLGTSVIYCGWVLVGCCVSLS